MKMKYTDFSFLDKEFLKKLVELKNKRTLARLTLLDFGENPIEYIETRVIDGSINVDANSNVRRTCSLNLLAEQKSITEHLWGLRSKFKLELGIENKIDPLYNDIIWFKQGTFVITGFTTSLSTSGYNISIQGKDKMCLLNGDLGGNIPHLSTDFGQYEKISTDGSISIEKIRIKDIVYKGVMTYGGELPSNIIVNDLDIMGYEQLDYRGNVPIYLFKAVGSTIYENGTLNGRMKCWVNGQQTTIGGINKYATNIDAIFTDDSDDKADRVTFSQDSKQQYIVFKLEAGMSPGFRLTELTYAGELVAAVGEAFTSVLDKIVQMLGNYEYFYDVDGRFIFQMKKNYMTTKWTGQIKDETGTTDVMDAYNDDTIQFFFDNNTLITAINNNPSLQNIKNNFTIWGQRKGVSGAEIPIHMCYAFDRKPVYYQTTGKYKDGAWGQSNIYTSDEYDWRELIYQMALDWMQNNAQDDFYFRVAQQNPEYYPSGSTGYEKYYTELEGFWRQLYTPLNELSINNQEINFNQQVYYRVNDDNKYEQIDRSQALTFIENIENDLFEYKKVEKTNEDGEVISFKFEYVLVDKKNLNAGINYYFRTKVEQDKENKEDEEEKEPEYLYTFAKEVYKYVDEPIYSSNKYNPSTYWNYDVSTNPEMLNFWFDFLEVEGTDLENYSVQSIGNRTKSDNDTSIKAIYYRDIPNLLFYKEGEEQDASQTGYASMVIPAYMENMFTVSTKSISLKDKIDNWLNQYTYSADTITLTSIPIYYLNVGQRISAKDEITKIDGEYLVQKISLHLGAQGTMAINAQKYINPIF